MCTGQLSVGGLTVVDFHCEPEQKYVLSLVKKFINDHAVSLPRPPYRDPESKVICLCYPTIILCVLTTWQLLL